MSAKVWENRKIRLCTLKNKEMYIGKIRFSSKNKDLFNFEKNKEVYIKNKVIYIFLFKK